MGEATQRKTWAGVGEGGAFIRRDLSKVGDTGLEHVTPACHAEVRNARKMQIQLQG